MEMRSCKGCIRTRITNMADDKKDRSSGAEVTMNGNMENGFDDSPRK